MLADNTIHHRSHVFQPSDLEQCLLVIAATNDAEVNQQIAALAHARNLPVNVVDNPELCSFIVPSILDRSPVIVAVSTGGTSPVLARQLRSRLEAVIPANFGRIAQLVEAFREKVKARFEPSARRHFWENILSGPIVELVLSGHEDKARSQLEDMINHHTATTAVGDVYLVGAGPGDPDLLTFKALRLMQQADIIVYDRLVSKAILNMARRDAEMIYVGKEKNFHAVPQDEINQWLVKLAKEGKRVCRLKGGDPFIFGRGGEEIEELAEAGIRFQIVPGITAAAGCASYSGIPLTHRDYAQSVVFITGHLKDGSLDINWPSLVQENQTIVFYMGLTAINEICTQLVKHGMDPRMPAALVEQGTTRNQRVHRGDLNTLPNIVSQSEVRAPTLIIIGKVVQLRDKLDWFQPDTNVQPSEFSSHTGKPVSGQTIS
jgi:uroporphyrin-III C-methyltransferase/precorrin-2 dehydrogenase/sirohydrochlorin ferrochelatase